jgi:hypothetical protein
MSGLPGEFGIRMALFGMIKNLERSLALPGRNHMALNQGIEIATIVTEYIGNERERRVQSETRTVHIDAPTSALLRIAQCA